MLYEWLTYCVALGSSPSIKCISLDAYHTHSLRFYAFELRFNLIMFFLEKIVVMKMEMRDAKGKHPGATSLIATKGW